MILPLPPGARTWRDCLDILPPAEHRIGGTDAAAILGLSPYRSPWDVWRAAHATATEQPDNAILSAGRIVEPVLLAWYGIRSRTWAAPGKIAIGPTFWMVATPDGLVSDDFDSPVRVVEVKTDRHREDRWPADGATVTEPGSIPDDYWVQALWYLACTGARVVDFVVATRTRGRWDPIVDEVAALALSTTEAAAVAMIRSWYATPAEARPEAPTTVRVVRVAPAPGYVEATVAAVADARERYLVRGEQPEVDASGACRQTLLERPRAPARVRATPAQAEALRRALEARQTAARAADMAAMAAAQLLDAMGDASKLTTDDGHAATIDTRGRLLLS